MNDSIQDDGLKFESHLGQWLHEAGDVDAAPREEHVAELRQSLLARTAPVSRSAMTRKRLAWSGLAAAAALVLGIVLLGDHFGTSAWAQVEKAVGSKHWIHSTGRLPDGKTIETWVSPTKLILAARAGEWAVLDDYRLGIRHEYRPGEKTLIRSALSDSSERIFRGTLDFYATMFAGKKRFPALGHPVKIVQQKRREISDKGRSWVEYELTYTVRGGSPKTQTSVFRVDPQTHLPVSVTRSQGPAKRWHATFDYPVKGPVSVYALGVPKDVKLVDRVPPPELDRLLDRRHEVRRDFDSYYGVIAWVRNGDHWSRGLQVQRVWRKGLRWRVEYMSNDIEGTDRILNREPPDDSIDPETWWFDEVKHLRFRPVLLSDGKDAYRYKYDHIETDDPRRWNLKVFPAEKDYMSLNPHDPIPSGMILPEHHLYGPTGAASSQNSVKLVIAPEDGPAGTVRVEVRHPRRQRHANSNDLDRFWIDPLENGMTRKWQMFSLFNDNEKMIREEQVIKTARTPQGYAYPTQMRLGGNGVTYFYLDFESKIEDSVFDPKLTSAAPSPTAKR